MTPSHVITPLTEPTAGGPGVLELGVLGPRLAGLDGPLVQALLQPGQAAVGQRRGAGVGVGAQGVGHAGVGVVVGEQVLLGRRVDGAVDGAVAGLGAVLLRLGAGEVVEASCRGRGGSGRGAAGQPPSLPSRCGRIQTAFTPRGPFPATRRKSR